MLFWGEKDLLHTAKLCGLKDVVSLLSKHEFYAKMDAQVTYYPLYVANNVNLAFYNLLPSLIIPKGCAFERGPV